MTTAAVNTFSLKEKSYARLHARFGHISSQKYKKITSVSSKVPFYDKCFIKEDNCVPGLTEKGLEASVRRA